MMGVHFDRRPGETEDAFIDRLKQYALAYRAAGRHAVPGMLLQAGSAAC
jgi:hypothetical protein